MATSNTEQAEAERRAVRRPGRDDENDAGAEDRPPAPLLDHRERAVRDDAERFESPGEHRRHEDVRMAPANGTHPTTGGAAS